MIKKRKFSFSKVRRKKKPTNLLRKWASGKDKRKALRADSNYKKALSEHILNCGEDSNHVWEEFKFQKTISFKYDKERT